MARSRRTITPPFAWLGRHSELASIIVTLGIGAFFRFFQLTTLPPGIDGQSALVGLQALAQISRGTLPGMNPINDYAPLWIELQASAIQVLGHTELALRLWPAILGTLAVLSTWLWMRSWFNTRIAGLTAFLVAVTPWAVTISRNGSQAAIWPFLVPLTIWLATRAWRTKTMMSYVLVGILLTLNLLLGPVGWLLVIVTLLSAARMLQRAKNLFTFESPKVVGVAITAAGIAFFTYLCGRALPALKSLPTSMGLAHTFQTLAATVGKTLIMFNVTGDQNYQHNLAGEPMLNAFVGLMLVAGLLVAISRLHDHRYRVLFAYLFILLVPAMLSATNAPNSARAAAALPVVLAFAAIGISYMLELWYQTFPINSAARLTGQTAIMALLALTLFQGYTQYFRAWAGTSAVYAAYNEGAVQMAAYLKSQGSFKGQNVIVATTAEQPVVAYLNAGGVSYTAVTGSQIIKLPSLPTSRQFIIAASSRNTSTKGLKAAFPGGVLYPHYSTFNQAEIYYTYVVGK